MTPPEPIVPSKRDKPGIIYLAKNKVNGKCYVGQTVDVLRRRKNNHKHQVNKGSGYTLHAAIKKYGMDKFEFTVLQDCCGRQCLNEAERWWIRHLDCMVPNGYNLTDGGEGGTQAEETCQKKSKSLKGREFSLEHRRRLSEGHKGYVTSDETKRKLSEMFTGRQAPWRKGPVSEEVRKRLLECAKRPKSEETKAKIAAAHKGRKITWNLKGIPHPNAKGKKKDPEVVARIAATQRGMKKPSLNGNHYRRDFLQRQKEESNRKNGQSSLDFGHGGFGI